MNLDAQEYTASDGNGDENSVEGTKEECWMSTPYLRSDRAATPLPLVTAFPPDHHRSLCWPVLAYRSCPAARLLEPQYTVIFGARFVNCKLCTEYQIRD